MHSGDRTKLQRALLFGAILVVVLLVFVFFLSGKKIVLPQLPKVPSEISALPFLLFYSLTRVCIAFVISLVTGIALGTWAATNPRVAKVLMPILDIGQSMPAVAFFPIVIAIFVQPLGGSRIGFEIASIFLICTCQIWNLAYGVYEAISTIPSDAKESMDAFGVKGWHRFWRLYLPACVPKLVYNSILSWANGWYFIILSEIITVGTVSTQLPGIGSYLVGTTNEGNIGQTFFGLGILLILIIGIELFIWVPLAGWSEKYAYELTAPMRWTGGSTLYKKWRQIHLKNRLRFLKHWLEDNFLDPVLKLGQPLARFKPPQSFNTGASTFMKWFWVLLLVGVLGYGLFLAAHGGYEALTRPWPITISELLLTIAASFLRVLIALFISILIAFPLAVWAGENKKVERFLNPLAEIGASVPATALFPIIVFFVIDFGGMNLASVLLLIAGMVWYLLFNLLVGVRSIPEDLYEASRSMGLRGWQRWQRLIFPALFPSLITGSITAFGGGWNALVVAEYFGYKGHTYKVEGIGSLLWESTMIQPDPTVLILSVISLILTVVLTNRLFWNPLYNLAAERFKIEN